jgi:hypothetical protein
MSKKIHLELEETDLYNALKQMINHPNAEEITKLLTPFIGTSPDCTKWLFKLLYGKKLPDLIPVGTICTTHVNNLTYEVDKATTIASDLSDNSGMIICTVKEFRGFHDWRQYGVESNGIDSSGVVKTFTSYLMTEQLEIMEEF